jgi:hypothetical protein
MNTSLEFAIDVCKGQSGLADKVRSYHEMHGRDCRVQQAHVWNWLNKQGGEVPSEHVIAVAWASEWRKLPHDFRPDLYPHPTDGLPIEIKRAMIDVGPALVMSSLQGLQPEVPSTPLRRVTDIQHPAFRNPYGPASPGEPAAKDGGSTEAGRE